MSRLSEIPLIGGICRFPVPSLRDPSRLLSRLSGIPQQGGIQRAGDSAQRRDLPLSRIPLWAAFWEAEQKAEQKAGHSAPGGICRLPAFRSERHSGKRNWEAEQRAEQKEMVYCFLFRFSGIVSHLR